MPAAIACSWGAGFGEDAHRPRAVRNPPVGFKRIQSTPDRMPGDIIGSDSLQEHDRRLESEYQPSTIFANLLPVDEINRTPPKTQGCPVGSHAEVLGAQPIAYDPMLDYWLRMASGAFGLIDGWYPVLMIWPQKFAAAIPRFGALMLVEECFLLFHRIRLSPPPFPFYADTVACFVGGSGILLLSRQAKRVEGNSPGR